MSDNFLGDPLLDWAPPEGPTMPCLDGQLVRLERLTVQDHADELYTAFAGHDALWDYMPVGPFASPEEFQQWVAQMQSSPDPMMFAIRDNASGQSCGVASYLRITPAGGAIEVGYICFSPLLQRRPQATEAMMLMMAWAFDAGYRRYEWKCNALNLPSRRAAQRLGFSYEGIFRQATVSKGRNRDTAWFAVIDKEWPQLRDAFQAWLSPDNFDAEGLQKTRLADLTGPVRVTSDPAVVD